MGEIFSKPSWISWSGFAFESICMKHIKQLKIALGIEGVHTEQYMWRYNPKQGEVGAQIDLIIDRQDRCVNLCEMKFSINEFEITKSYANELQSKMNVFSQKSKSRKTLLLTMVTTNGVKNISNYVGLIQNEVKMDDLFS